MEVIVDALFCCCCSDPFLGVKLQSFDIDEVQKIYIYIYIYIYIHVCIYEVNNFKGS